MSASVASPDVLDRVAGIEPSSTLDALRHARPAARTHTQRAHDVLLDPADDRGFTRAERLAVASFVLGLHRGGPGRGIPALAQTYDDALRELAPDLADAVQHAATAARRPGPYGVYREVGLASESEPGEAVTAAADPGAGLDDRLAAGLDHAALLVLRPREASPEALAALAGAGWTPAQVVELSQLVSFLTYQARIAHALAVVVDDDPALATRPDGDPR